MIGIGVCCPHLPFTAALPPIQLLEAVKIISVYIINKGWQCTHTSEPVVGTTSIRFHKNYCSRNRPIGWVAANWFRWKELLLTKSKPLLYRTVFELFSLLQYQGNRLHYGRFHAAIAVAFDYWQVLSLPFPVVDITKQSICSTIGWPVNI
jgi:hypothetical protein